MATKARKGKTWGMGYRPETIRNFKMKADAIITKYQSVNVTDIKFTISSGNKKIGHVMNVSTLPVYTCKNCSGCVKFCYDIKALLMYPSAIDARVRNTVILWRDRDLFFRLIDEKMSRRRKNKYFRWHVAGDIVDLDYFSRMVENARRHPDFVIWTYTKNYAVVNEYCDIYGKDSIPANFTVMFSEWRGMPIVNPYNFPEFRVFEEGEQIPTTAHVCPGNCNICKETGKGCPFGQTTYCKLH